MSAEPEVLVLGAGLCGLAAASELGHRAVVLEQAERPGGLVRTEHRDGFWFDHVIHLLYFRDVETEGRIADLLGDVLQPCPPVAWVDTAHGSARFPLQHHLGDLAPECALRCIRDFVAASRASQKKPQNYEELLESTFGRAMVDTFFGPYNRKMWKRPLRRLAADGFQWNLARPSLDEAVAGLIDPGRHVASYNQRAWYPRPAHHAPVRGMEVLSHALATRVPHLLLRHRVTRIELRKRVVTAMVGGEERRFRWERACLSTLPLPQAVRMCDEVPAALRDACARLRWNRVYTVALSIRGPRPSGTGHWRYVADEDLSFTRLVFLHEFDPATAPGDGWGLLAEVTQPAEEPLLDKGRLAVRVQEEIRRSGVLGDSCRIADVQVIVIDPAYVVFTPETETIVDEARAFLERHAVTPLGRYGQWEYSSMASVMRDGFRWAGALARPSEPT